MTLSGLCYYYKARALFGRQDPAAKAMRANRDRFYARVWQEAARDLDLASRQLGADILEIENGTRRIRVCRNQSPFDDSVTLALAGNKPVVYDLLEEAGLPVPRHRRFDIEDFAAARAFLESAGGPVVVKPAYDTGAGAGVTANITDLRRLRHAVAWARAFCPNMVIEEQIEGDNYRLLFLDGELLDCILRRPPVVIGDGRSTVRQLVDRENNARVRAGDRLAQVPLAVDLDMRNTLAVQDLRLSSILPEGRVVAVKRVINDNRGEDNEPAADGLHESIVRAGAQAARLVGARLAGVDMIITDRRRPLGESGAVVIDVNTTPGFYYHYFKKERAFPVALSVLRRAIEDGG